MDVVRGFGVSHSRRVSPLWYLRCAGLGPRDLEWTRGFIFDLPNGIKSCFVEFQDVRWEHGQQILDGSAGSLEK